MFSIKDEDDYTKIIVDGKLKSSDYVNTLIPKIEEISKDGAMKIMAIMNGFEGIELTAMLDDLITACKHRKEFEKVAVVTHSSWMKFGLNVFGTIISGDVKTFDNEHDAREWLIKVVQGK